VIVIVYTQFTNVATGHITQPGGPGFGDPWVLSWALVSIAFNNSLVSRRKYDNKGRKKSKTKEGNNNLKKSLAKVTNGETKNTTEGEKEER
jgi:hypothetical protein